MALAYVSDLEAFLGSTVNATRGQLMIDLATGAVTSAADVPILEVVDDEAIVDGTGAVTLLLPSYPVTAVASVEIDGEALTADEYTWSRSGVIERTAGWPIGRRNITVTYTHGFADADVPAEIKKAVLVLAARGMANPFGLTQETLGDLSRSWAAAGMNLTGDEEDMIRRAIR